MKQTRSDAMTRTTKQTPECTCTNDSHPKWHGRDCAVTRVKSPAPQPATETRERKPTHVRVVVRRSGKRINDAPGTSYTLCGGAMTAYDVEVADANHATCDKCREAVSR